MRHFAVRLAGACASALLLAACNLGGEVGYVEIKTVPVSSAPTLYLDSTRLEPLTKGVAILRQRVGTATLQTVGGGGQLASLCEIVVKKNRITTVTVSILDRPPRCQCKNPGGAKPPASRTCLS